MRQAGILLWVLVMVGCDRKERAPLFTKMEPARTGVEFKNWNIESERLNIFTYEYFYNGGGVALGDINNDGLLDIYFTSNNAANKLYLNKGGLKFEDITAISGTACPKGWKTGATMVDINGDGWLDIYVCRSLHSDSLMRENLFFINNKNLTFTDQARSMGLADRSYTTHTAFFDFDRDGDLDAFVLNHSLLHISNAFDISRKNTKQRFPHVGNRLYRNDGGHFADVSDIMGIYGPASNYGLGLGLSDLNNDGWMDVYTGCDYTGRDRLLLNNNGSFFADVTDSMLSHISKFTMGLDIADFNNDGWMDIYTLDMLPEDNRRQKLLMGADQHNVFNEMVSNGLHQQYMRNMLQINTGVGYFSEAGQMANVSNTDWSWAPLLADFDNDGILDLFVSNGFKHDLTNSDFAKYHAFRMMDSAMAAGKPINPLQLINRFNQNRMHNYIYKGTADSRFENKVSDWGFEEPTLTSGAAYGDLDNDGDLDLVLNNLNEVAGIYRNNASVSAQNHFLQIRLEGEDANTQAIGARVTIYTGRGVLVREMQPARGFQSSVDPTLHFGLGSTTTIDSVVIQWPSGVQQRVPDVSVDMQVLIKHEASHPIDFSKPSGWFTRFDGVDFSHVENEHVDFNIQPLLPRQYSTQGPALACGDVNGDGRNDLYVGGSKGYPGNLLIQRTDGSYAVMVQSVFEADRQSEDVDAVFFDADEDDDTDLYVVSGGYEFEKEDPALQDRLYLNNGKGEFVKGQLPEMKSSGSCVRPCDIDGDGDKDLFVGGRLVPGRYPEPPRSYLLVNQGGVFSIAETPELGQLGMITDAAWTDLNKDAYLDLIVVGEWMGIEVFTNQQGELKRETDRFLADNSVGWWNTIVSGDFDADGDGDFLLGNAGINNQIKADRSHPAHLYFSDFDSNGSVDPIISYFINDNTYPSATRDELLEQLPLLRSSYTSYAAYSDVTDQQVIEALPASYVELQMNEMRSCYLRNDEGRLVLVPLPVELQIAPVFAFAVRDLNEDGKLDFVSGGNLSATRSRSGRMTGNTGYTFLGDGNGNFSFVRPEFAGLRCVGDVRAMKWDNNRLIVGVNNAPIQIYTLQPARKQ